MLQFYCDNSIKEELKEKIISELFKQKITVSSNHWGDFTITESERGFSVNGMKYCVIYSDGKVFRIEEFKKDDVVNHLDSNQRFKIRLV